MDITLRPVTPDEFADFQRAASNGFAGHADDDHVERNRSVFEFERSIAAFEGNTIVGTGDCFKFDLTLPGGTTLPAAGVSWITVMPTHRRQGILTSIMRRQLQDVREWNEPLAMLYASESLIYGRFGYGVATIHCRAQIDTRYAAFAQVPQLSGRVRMIGKVDAGSLLPPMYERFRAIQPGALTRSDTWWRYYLSDPKDWHGDSSARFYVIYETAGGTIDGYAAYRTNNNWEAGVPVGTLRLQELHSLTREAHSALWQYLLSVDLIPNVAVWSLPIDEPLRWMLADHRRLKMTMYDGLWVRLVDIPAALAGRRYASEERIVFRVEDRFCPENSGTYELEGSPDGATCRRSTREPDLELEVADLGATYLGGTAFFTLAAAGRIAERTSGALRRADSMFAAHPAPWCTTDF